MAIKKYNKLYYMSDKAYDAIVLKATQQQYITSIQRATGVSEFLEALSQYEFTDTRPDAVKERHNDEIYTLRAPLWKSHYDRRTRTVTLTQEAMNSYLALAMSAGIIKSEPWIIGGPRRLSIPSILGYVFEAIGLGWLTPEKYPVKNWEKNVKRQYNKVVS